MSSNSSKLSGSKSKRSFNSNNSSIKKTKISTNQKNLSFQRSPFPDFRSYMVEKNRKLENQFDTEASSSLSSEKSVFRGVSIFVDGLTVPPSSQGKSFAEV